MGAGYQYWEDQGKTSVPSDQKEDTGASSTDSQDYTDHTVVVLEIDELTQPVNIYGSFSCARRKARNI